MFILRASPTWRPPLPCVLASTCGIAARTYPQGVLRGGGAARWSTKGLLSLERGADRRAAAGSSTDVASDDLEAAAPRHTSGMPDYTQAPGFGRRAGRLSGGSSPARRAAGLRRGRGPATSRRGPDYRYSNSENIAVGMMVEAVTGASYEHAVRAKVTAPLDLRRAGIPPLHADCPIPSSMATCGMRESLRTTAEWFPPPRRRSCLGRLGMGLGGMRRDPD